jgi:DNA-binding CsgD family transcriptional regulator
MDLLLQSSRATHQPVSLPAHTPPGLQHATAVLDEIDYGVLLVSRSLDLRYCNYAARAELRSGHPMSVVDGRLDVADARSQARLQAAVLDAADQMLRSWLTLDAPGRPASLSVVPLGRESLHGPTAVLLLMGRRDLCARLTAERYAATHGLTSAETAVLVALVDGLQPRRIAELHGVSLSTVRTQLQSIREKTGTGDIRELVMQVATLAPMVGRLRN